MGDHDSVWHVFEVNYEGELKHESEPDKTTPKEAASKVIEFKKPDSGK